MATYLVGTLQNSGLPGILQDVTKTEEHDVSEVRDELGNVLEVQYYNRRNVLNANLILPGMSSAPNVGDSITVDNIAYLVQSCSVTSSNTDVTKCAVTLVHYIENNISSAYLGPNS